MFYDLAMAFVGMVTKKLVPEYQERNIRIFMVTFIAAKNWKQHNVHQQKN